MLYLAIAFVFVLLDSHPAAAQLDQLLRGILQGQQPPAAPAAGGGLTDDKVAAGLKQALEVASGKAVDLTGAVDGYFKNQAIKILVPESLRTWEAGLRAVGLGSQVDAFVLSMNRAAERAAPAARQIFTDALSDMSFEDARQILTGGDTAATAYFKDRTSDRLTDEFRPVVARSMDEVGVTRQYKDLAARVERLPFIKTEAVDVDDYVTDKTLDGLFHVVAEQEKLIRTNPSARVTDLLREVFGQR